MWSFWTVSHVDFYVAAWSVLENSSERKERARRGWRLSSGEEFVPSRDLNL